MRFHLVILLYSVLEVFTSSLLGIVFFVFILGTTTCKLINLNHYLRILKATYSNYMTLFFQQIIQFVCILYFAMMIKLNFG